MTTYTNRLSALTKEKNYTLSETGIGDGMGEWSYTDIKEVKLKFTPTRYYGGIYQCIITSKAGGKVTLSNRKYKGPADFEYQNAEYNRFIWQLHQNLMAYSHVRYVTGMEKARFMIGLIGSLIFFPLMIYAMFALGQALVAGIVLLILVVRLVPYYKKNKPNTYSPEEIPMGLIPND